MNTTISFRSFRAIAAGRQIIGNRKRQEDSFRIHSRNEGSAEQQLLGILSDGMGGMGDGDIAGATIVQAFWESYSAGESGDLLKSLRSANLSLLRKKQAGEIGEKSGGTVIAMQVEEAGFSWLSIGDSLLFLQRKGKVTKLNAAHTWGWELERRVREGEMSQAEAEACDIPREALYAAVCGNDIPAVDICPPSRCRIGDRLIIASDGLLPLLGRHPETVFNAQEIRTAAPDEACEILLSRLQQAAPPHLDNSTILIMDIVSPSGDEGADTSPGEWRSAGISELGDRSNQQDATLVKFSNQAALAIVADGAGGHTGGAMASATAVRTLKETWARSLSAGLSAEAAAMVLREAVVQAHQAILETAEGNYKRCGKCALVLLYLCGREYTIVSAGDCRCYQSSSRGWELKTHDDSLLQLQLDRGLIKPEAAAGHPDQGILTQALGGEQPPSPHVIQGKHEIDSTFLLCCDGFWNQLPPGWAAEPWHAEQGFASHKDVLGNKVKQAIAGARGNSDNVSAIWVYGARHSTVAPRRSRSCLLLLLFCLLGALGAMAINFSVYLTPEAEKLPGNIQHQQKPKNEENTKQQQRRLGEEKLPFADPSTDTGAQNPATQLPQPSTDFPSSPEATPSKDDRAKDSPIQEGQPSMHSEQQGAPQQDNEQHFSAALPQDAPVNQNIIEQENGHKLHSSTKEKIPAIQDNNTQDEPPCLHSSPRNMSPAEHSEETLEDNAQEQHWEIEEAPPIPQSVHEVVFSRDGQYMAFFDHNESLYLSTGVPSESILQLQQEDGINAVSFSPDSRQIAAGLKNRQINIILLATSSISHTIIADDVISAVRFSPSGKRLAVGTNNKAAVIYNLADNTKLVAVPYNGLPHAIAFSPKGLYFIACGEMGEVNVVIFKDLQNDRKQFHSKRINCVAFSEEGNFLATGSDDHTAIVRDASSHDIIMQVAHDDAVLSVSFSPDGKYLATGSADNTVRVTEISTGHTVCSIVLPDAATSVCFAPDGSILAVACADSRAYLYHFTSTPRPNNEQY